VSDITKVPQPDGSFDRVMCIEEIEYLPDDTDEAKEFSKHLRTKGLSASTAPFNSLPRFSP